MTGKRDQRGRGCGAEEAARAIQSLVRAAALERGLGALDELPVDLLDLKLRVPLGGAEFLGKDLQAEIGRRLDEALAAATCFRAGRVYCFQCDSPACQHSAPPDGRSVFAGFHPTGKPEWLELAAAFLRWGVEDVDELYAEPPGVVAVVRSGADLNAALMEGFGRGERRYAVLGQVCAGYIPVRDPNGDGRAALCVQAVASRWGDGITRMSVNALGLDHLPSEGGLWERSVLRSIVAEAQMQLTGAERKARGPLNERAEPALAHMRAAIDRVFRPLPHVTGHAMERRRSRERPTSAALSDAAEASDERLLFDERRDTIVVLGPRSRVHVFSRSGRHVTSMTESPDNTDRKVRAGIWKPLDAGSLASFRAAVRRQGDESGA